MQTDNKLVNLLKKASAYLQTAAGSFNRHNLEYSKPGEVEVERKRSEEFERQDVFNNQEYKLGNFLALYGGVRNIAVDIGSGAGWFSSKLSEYFKTVISIEPSKDAIAIAEALYPQNRYPNIRHIQGFAENILADLEIKEPALFFTGVVLSHLRDQEVTKICTAVNQVALKGSLLSFNECWGNEWHQLMWHVRSKEWWQENLPGWDINFHGPQIENIPGRHKGFNAVKIR